MIAVVDATEAMVPAIAAIEQECFSDPWTQQAIQSQLTGPNHIFLAAVDGENVAGYVGLMYVIDEGYIANVAVTADYRRQHIADLLIAELVRRGQELHLAFLTLEVRASNEPAQALYRKHGFEVVGLRKRYYEKPREDALLMTLYLKEERT